MNIEVLAPQRNTFKIQKYTTVFTFMRVQEALEYIKKKKTTKNNRINIFILSIQMG